MFIDGAWYFDTDATAPFRYIDEINARMEACQKKGDACSQWELADSDNKWNQFFQYWVSLMSSVDADQVSILDICEYRDTHEDWPVMKGYGALIAQQGADCPVDLNCVVTKINWGDLPISIETSQGVITADRVVITASTGVLNAGDIEFNPKLPGWKMEAINALPLGNSNYTFCTFEPVNATFATLLGTLAGLALARFRYFRGRTLFTGMISAPLVMPEVITGLSLLLLFITLGDLIGWPEKRGITTITIAHITFSLAYVAVIIESRLSGIGETLEEAALDLGAKPLRVMIDITLPLLAPGMLAGWLLAFTLSLDDLVIASFVSGPGSSTLPMLIYSRVKLGLKPDINALATMIILAVAIGVLIAGWILIRQQKQRQRDAQLAGAE